MRSSIVVLAFFLGLCLQSTVAELSSAQEIHRNLKRDAEERDVVVQQTATEYRAYEAQWWPEVDPRIIQLVGVDAKLTGGNTATVDAVEFIMDDLAQASLFFGYYHAKESIPDRNGTTANLTAAEFAFAMRSFAAFEFEDNNGIPGFQNDTSDTISGGYDLSNVLLPWKPMDIVSENVTYNGTNFHLFTVTIQTLDEVFLMRFIAVGYDAVVEGVHVSPTTIKVDLEVRWFTPLHVAAAWTTGPSSAAVNPHAGVGLLTVFAAAAGEFSETSGSPSANPGVSVASGNYTGFFSWQPTANITIAGVETEGYVYGSVQTVGDSSINASFAEEWILRAGFFSFEGDRPALVSWDPEFGAALQPPAQTTTSTSTGSVSSTGSTSSTGSHKNAAMKTGASLVTVFFALAAFLF